MELSTSCRGCFRFSNINLDGSKPHIYGGKFTSPMCKNIVHITINTGHVCSLQMVYVSLHLAISWRKLVLS